MLGRSPSPGVTRSPFAKRGLTGKSGFEPDLKLKFSRAKVAEIRKETRQLISRIVPLEVINSLRELSKIPML